MKLTSQELATSARNLNIGSTTNESVILSSYDQLRKANDGQEEVLRVLTTSKNILLANIVKTRSLEEKTQRVQLDIRVRNFCKKCDGKGFFPIFKVEVLHRPCTDCGGTGVLSKKCKTCNGNGEIYIDPPEREPAMVQMKEKKICPTCRGTKKYRFVKNSKRRKDIKCPKCKGGGLVDVLNQTSKLDNIRICGACKGTGKRSDRPSIKANDTKTNASIAELVSPETRLKLSQLELG